MIFQIRIDVPSGNKLSSPPLLRSSTDSAVFLQFVLRCSTGGVLQMSLLPSSVCSLITISGGPRATNDPSPPPRYPPYLTRPPLEVPSIGFVFAPFSPHCSRLVAILRVCHKRRRPLREDICMHRVTPGDGIIANAYLCRRNLPFVYA